MRHEQPARPNYPNLAHSVQIEKKDGGHSSCWVQNQISKMGLSKKKVPKMQWFINPKALTLTSNRCGRHGRHVPQQPGNGHGCPVMFSTPKSPVGFAQKLGIHPWFGHCNRKMIINHWIFSGYSQDNTRCYRCYQILEIVETLIHRDSSMIWLPWDSKAFNSRNKIGGPFHWSQAFHPSSNVRCGSAICLKAAPSHCVRPSRNHKIHGPVVQTLHFQNS